MDALHVPVDGGTQLNVLGIPMLIRLHGRDTGGVLSAVESHDVPGGGPPMHIHNREDETFQILAGPYEFIIADQTVTVQTGDTLFAPKGAPHTYRYVGKGIGRLMCIITPAGFEDFFAEVSALTPQQQQDIPLLLELGNKYGLEFVPPED